VASPAGARATRWPENFFFDSQLRRRTARRRRACAVAARLRESVSDPQGAASHSAAMSKRKAGTKNHPPRANGQRKSLGTAMNTKATKRAAVASTTKSATATGGTRRQRSAAVGGTGGGPATPTATSGRKRRKPFVL